MYLLIQENSPYYVVVSFIISFGFLIFTDILKGGLIVLHCIDEKLKNSEDLECVTYVYFSLNQFSIFSYVNKI